MSLIIFLRHGQARNNIDRVLSGRTPGVSLTDLGIEQARQAAGLAAKIPIRKIYTSPMERAQRTAEIVGEHNSVEVVSDERLIELDMGKFTGIAYEEIFARHGNVFLKFYSGDLELAHNGVETFEEVKKRVFSMIQHVRDNHAGENVMLVTHMDPIKAILSTVLDLTPQILFELILANASMTILDDTEGSLSLKAVNVMDPSRFLQMW